jgi:hypothetical protein
VVVVVELDPPQATAKIPVRNTLDTRMSVQKASDDLNLTVTIDLLRSGFLLERAKEEKRRRHANHSDRIVFAFRLI